MTRERRLVFGEVADVYDRVRPTYPDALIDRIIAAGDVTPGDRLLEVGAGTGKATRSFVARGVAVTAIEPDPAMAAMARRNCPEATVVVSSFEDATVDAGAFAVVAAAQSWHWVRPDVGPAKAASALRAGGSIALFWNWSLPHPLHDSFQQVYDREAPRLPLATAVQPNAVRHEGVATALDQLRSSGRFAPPTQETFDWTRRFDTATYTALLTTHSDHRLLTPDHLNRLLDGIGAVIDDAGGSFDLPHTSTLLLAARL
jgi:SAM-dependent methyltransferase